MNGIVKSDGGFAEYMIGSHYSLVHLPDDVSFEQAAPLMCAGVSLHLHSQILISWILTYRVGYSLERN